MQTPFNPDILTVFPVFNHLDENVILFFNRLEVLKQPNQTYIQNAFNDNVLLAEVVFSPEGIVQTITTYHKGVDITRQFEYNRLINQIYTYK
jgi:hypothetical protein